MALTFRSDRPELDDVAAQALTEFARSQGLTLFVYAQVRRDRQAMKALADRLGAEYRDWSDDALHDEFEKTVRSWLSTSRFVASDRLHALVIGATEGAVPVGLIPRHDRKVASHLEAVGLAAATLRSDGRTDSELASGLQAALPLESVLAERCRLARAELNVLLADVRGDIEIGRNRAL